MADRDNLISDRSIEALRALRFDKDPGTVVDVFDGQRVVASFALASDAETFMRLHGLGRYGVRPERPEFLTVRQHAALAALNGLLMAQGAATPVDDGSMVRRAVVLGDALLAAAGPAAPGEESTA